MKRATYAVGREKVREYAHAVGETEPLYLDVEAARAAGHADVVAPPMFDAVYCAPAVGPAILDPEAGIDFAILGSSEQCTGDPAKRTGNEYMFQELATGNIETLKAAGPKTILTSCPHCVKTIGDDYRRFGYEVTIVHSAVFVADLMAGAAPRAGAAEVVTYHDPCYLGRYAGKVDEPRALLERFGAEVHEPERNRDNPYCCGAGGGLLFADKEEEPGSRISDVRFKQLSATGAQTVVTACPFCSIMLKGAQASAPASEIQFVDLMTYVNGRLDKA